MAHVIVAGAGAIGSHLLPHLARLPLVDRITIVDPDSYEASNIVGQDIDAHSIDRPKAIVQARRLRRIRPSLELTAIVRCVEDLPLGHLRASLLVSCLDSRRSRMFVNQTAWRLGIPWVDAGVMASGMLARVTAFRPATDSACLECGFGPGDYAVLEQTYPCSAATAAPPTAAPSALGALAAALQAIECGKLLAGAVADALVGRDVLIDARHHTHYLSTLRRNPDCRMPDHSGWRIEPFYAAAADTTLGDALAMGSVLLGGSEGVSLRVAGQRFATSVQCEACDNTDPVLMLDRSIRCSPHACSRCGRAMQPIGFGLSDQIELPTATGRVLEMSFAHVGVMPGDVFSLETSRATVHYELRDAV